MARLNGQYSRAATLETFAWEIAYKAEGGASLAGFGWGYRTFIL
jgi:hypothetical protein